MDISQKILSDITVFNKYAKFNSKLQRRETWEEICERNMAMHLKKFPTLKKEIKDVYQNFVIPKKVLPSMRSAQFAGAPIELSNNRIFNCAYAAVDDIAVFSEAMFLLLGGTGFGYSVQRRDVEKLPIVKGPTEKTRRFLVGDSIEGWADAIKVLIKAYFLGRSNPLFDYRDIRPKGSRLVTSGGKAPGPDPLRLCVDQISAVLSGAIGRRLTPLEAHDIMCFIADAVLSGGIRRAALISLFSKDDLDMMSSKAGQWWEANPQRGRANNSVVLHREETTEEEFKAIWERVQLSGAGEPGIFWTNDYDLGTNPCAEISLRSKQFCVSADTKLITRTGIVSIANVVGQPVDIWNGEKWSTVTPFQTGTNDTLHRVCFSDGSFLDATDNHKFLVKNRFETEYREVETLELIELLKTQKYEVHVPRANVKYEEGISHPLAYDYGFILGDGCVPTNKNYVGAGLFGPDKHLNFESAIVGKTYTNYRGTPFTNVTFDVDVEFARRLKYENGLPSEIFTWDKNSILKFIAGWADADGTKASNGIRIAGREDKLRDAQLLLTKIGITCSLNLGQLAGTKTNLGTRKNDIWYIQITKTAEIPALRVVCDNIHEPKWKGKNQIIKRIVTLPGKHPSFCVSEPDLHQCVFNNVLTKQCNLTETNVSDVTCQEDLNERVKAGAFLGTLQAAYTDFHYLRSDWKEITEEEALIGVGMTGIASGTLTNLNLEEAAKVACEENARVAAILGINPAARVTTIKPSGTSSLTVGSSSGVHAWHNDFYVRRMRVGKNEPLYRYMIENFPSLIEDCKFKPHLEAVMSFPQRAPAGAILRHESFMDLLERVKRLNIEWVHPGHRTGNNYHNVSCTISLKDREWERCGKWMWKNREFYTGISVLPYDGGSYVQAPFGDCTEETFDEMMKHLHAIDLTKVREEDDNTSLNGEVACAGGACEITF